MNLDPTTIIQNPTKFTISDLYKNNTLSQVDSVFKIAEDILVNLDEYALKELCEGYSWDIDNLFLEIVSESSKILSNCGSIKTASFGYLSSLTNSLDDYLTDLSFSYFVSGKLPDFNIEPYHLEWMNLAQIYRFLCILAARGHSKSYCFSFAYPLWQMWRYNKKNKIGGEGLFITAEDSLAKHFMEMVSHEIEDNPLLREKLYPGKSAVGWGKERLITKNKFVLEGKSSNANLRGRHDTAFVVCDDFLDELNMFNADIRKYTIDFFHSVIMNIPIYESTKVFVVGTPMSEDDLYANLKKSKGWRVFEYPAIYPDGKLLSPDRFTLEGLLDKRESQGSIVFSREILVKPISSALSLFSMALLKSALVDTMPMVYNKFSIPFKIVKIGLGIDLSISAELKADYFVAITVGMDEQKRYWVLNVVREKGLSYKQQLEIVKRMEENFRYDVIMCENNQYQEAFCQLLRDNGIPVISKFTGIDKYSFTVGLPAVSVLFEQARIKIPYQNDPATRNAAEILMSELHSMTFANNKLQGMGSHDDTTSALWKAIQSLNYVNSEIMINFLEH